MRIYPNEKKCFARASNALLHLITLNSRLEQHSATILKFASFVHIVYTKTTINIHMRISQMRKYDSAIFIALNGRLVRPF